MGGGKFNHSDWGSRGGCFYLFLRMRLPEKLLRDLAEVVDEPDGGVALKRVLE